MQTAAAPTGPAQGQAIAQTAVALERAAKGRATVDGDAEALQMEVIVHRPLGPIRANAGKKGRGYTNEFHRLHPPKFIGKTGPIAVED